MPDNCVAINCPNVKGKSPAKTFLRFPFRNPSVLEKWIKNVNKTNWRPSYSSMLCSDHFEDKCFVRIGSKVLIRGCPIPTIFSDSTENIEQNVEQCTIKLENTPMPQIVEVVSLQNSLIPWSAIQTDEISHFEETLVKEEELSSRTSLSSLDCTELKHKLALSLNRLAFNQRRVRALQLRSRRLRKRMAQIPLIMMLLMREDFSR